MLFCNSNKPILRAVSVVLISGLLLSGAGIPSYAVADPSDAALAPPLFTKRPCEIVRNPDGSLDVVTNNDVIEAWDRETVRSYGQGVTASGDASRNRWAYVDIGILIGQMLILTQDKEHKLHNPKDRLIYLIKKHIRNRNGESEILLEGYDIDGIEEVREGGEVTGFSLPVTRNGTPAYRLIYNLQGGDTDIQMKDGTKVYVTADLDTETSVRILTCLGGFGHENAMSPSLNELLQDLDTRSYDVLKLMESSLNFKPYEEELKKYLDEIHASIFGGLDAQLHMAEEMIAKKTWTNEEIAVIRQKAFDSYHRFELNRKKAELLLEKVRPSLSENEREDVILLNKGLNETSARMAARFSLADSKVANEIFNLNDVLNTLFEHLPKRIAREAKECLKLKIPAKPVYMKGDAISITSVLCNIVANCIRYAKSENLKVVMDVRQEGGEVSIAISDNGVGMTQEQLRNTWKPFYTTKGTGIGLTESRLVIKDHGGTISVQSELGKGTTFTLRLPVASEPSSGRAMRLPVADEDVKIEEPSSTREELIRLYHCVDLKKIPDILRYGFYQAIGIPTFTDNENLSINNHFGYGMVMLVFDVPRKLIDETGPGLSRAAKVEVLPNEVKNGKIISEELVATAARGSLGRLNTAYINYQETLTVNRKLVKMFKGAPITNEIVKYLEGCFAKFPQDEKSKILKPKIAAGAATKIDIASSESERIHTTNFQDTLTYIQAQPQSQPIIVALGTSWITGYEEGRYLQHSALNPLISSMGKRPQFIVGDDKDLLKEIRKKIATKGFENARVIVLAGEETVTNDLKELNNGKNILLGVDNKYLVVDSYVRVMEMLEIASKLALDPDTPPSSPNIPMERRGSFWVFIPKAEPIVRNYEQLKATYKAQEFA